MVIKPPFAAVLLTCGVFALSGMARAELATITVGSSDAAGSYRADGVVEAVRHADIAAQVPGRITSVPVKAGDRVTAGAVLALIDARAAQDQQAAAQAQLAAAQHDFERSRELFAQNYISKAAMDRAEAQYRVLRAQANSADTQNDFHRVAAPYPGIVAEVMVEPGDMAQPGRPLFSFYDPLQLRVTVQIPESVAATLVQTQSVRIEIPNAPSAQRDLVAQSITLLPTANTTAHTREVRLDLPVNAAVAPGTFARAVLPLTGVASMHVNIPVKSVLTRTEFQGVYVVDATGRAQLRQVRLGQQSVDQVEVLAGLHQGERIAVDPLAALRASQGAGNE